MMRVVLAWKITDKNHRLSLHSCQGVSHAIWCFSIVPSLMDFYSMIDKADSMLMYIQTKEEKCVHFRIKK
jgi:hypothetical protein